AERPDLARIRILRKDPTAGVPGTRSGLDPQVPASLGKGLLESPDERADQQAPARQGEDWIGHQLARAVIGDLAAAFDPDQLDAPSLELPGRRTNVALVGVSAEGQDRWMLEEQELGGN